MRFLSILCCFVAAPVLAQNTLTFREFEPIVVKHGAGEEVQVLFAKGSMFQFVEDWQIKPAGDGHSVWTAPAGSYILNASGKLKIVNITADDGPDGPEEPPTDPPGEPDPVPRDRFDDIGRRVSQWAAGLSQNEGMAAIYRRYSLEFERAQQNEVTPLFDAFNEDVRELLDGNSEYATFRDKYHSDLSERWVGDGWAKDENLGKTVADYFAAIATGLEAAS